MSSQQPLLSGSFGPGWRPFRKVRDARAPCPWAWHAREDPSLAGLTSTGESSIDRARQGPESTGRPRCGDWEGDWSRPPLGLQGRGDDLSVGVMGRSLAAWPQHPVMRSVVRRSLRASCRSRLEGMNAPVDGRGFRQDGPGPSATTTLDRNNERPRRAVGALRRPRDHYPHDVVPPGAVCSRFRA
jgi:hypothetical protein